MPRTIEVDQLAEVLPPGGLTLVSGCSAESDLLADAVEHAGAALGAMTFSGIFVGGLNTRAWDAGPDSRVLTFFQTPVLKAAAARVEFLPLCYQDVLAELRRRRPAAALFMCAPPDADGFCSFGTQVDFLAELWREIPIRIAHINPLMPRTPGDRGIPVIELTAVIEGEQPLRSLAAGPADPVAQAIAAHVAPFVPDGATLQTGLGKVPDAILGALTTRRDLRVHTGLIGDGVLSLLASGAMAKGRSVTVGVAIGSDALYGGLDHPALQFRPVSITHDPAVLAAIPDLITINSGIEVDLFGQAYAELTPKGWMSGPGGASDFARGARGHGLRIVVLPATARGISRIVPPGAAAGPVSLGRMDIDIVATEHGAADLRRLGHDARAAALIAIAAPDHSASLSEAWAQFNRRM
ncbi:MULTISPECIES: acetyl-CoA hydrolase/transferase family protein [unclassified Sphingomonas]|uniref:acetyl-CoA hydrolase/transferase family protein n=1 Tax=unclassified Sphingomonas TaxID=196159 RepID=UPI00082F29FD|nr:MULTISPECIES: acetyl-CoA hydrolase/transferase C-terminal domain-containing protein [unclassified Sphingomonas]